MSAGYRISGKWGVSGQRDRADVAGLGGEGGVDRVACGYGREVDGDGLAARARCPETPHLPLALVMTIEITSIACQQCVAARIASDW